MFIDYEKLVLADYEYKRSNNMLSTGLADPTQARLKKECLQLCSGLVDGKDERIIREFCEERKSDRNCYQMIEDYDVDKFKPLSKFLKKISESTDSRNIQLLAWLINFPYRPFEYNRDYSNLPTKIIEFGATKSNGSSIEAMSPIGDPVYSSSLYEKGSDPNVPGDSSTDIAPSSSSPQTSPNICTPTNNPDQLPIEQTSTATPRQKWHLHKLVATTILLSLLGCGGWWWSRTGSKNIMSGTGGCMYWTVDHYQPISCDQKVPNTLVIALDVDKVKNFRKIMRPDTITNRAKGLVWYSKINNRVEFFTEEGDHPVFIDRHLKPATDYIINKYNHTGIIAN